MKSVKDIFVDELGEDMATRINLASRIVNNAKRLDPPHGLGMTAAELAEDMKERPVAVIKYLVEYEDLFVKILFDRKILTDDYSPEN